MKFQHIVMPADQLMIIDGQPTHHVIVNQQPIAYEQESTSGIIAFPQHQSQTVFYMDNSGNVPTELAQVEAVELQPILLNHQLGSQISLVQRPAKVNTMTTQQLGLMQQVQRLNTPKVVRTQVNQMNSPQTVQLASPGQHGQHFVRQQAIQQRQHDTSGDQPSVTIERANQIPRQQQMNVQGQQFQRTIDATLSQVTQQKSQQQQFQAKQSVIGQMNDADSKDTVSLSDGKVMAINEYKEMIFKQQQQRLNMMPEVSVKKTRAPNPNTVKPRAKPLPINRNRGKIHSEGPDQVRFGQRYVDSPQLQPVRRPPPSPVPSPVGMQHRPGTPQQQYQQSNQSTPKIPQIPTPPPQLPPTPVPQQQQRQNNHNYLIQVPKHNPNKNIVNCPLPSCVPSSQIKKIIESTPISEEYSDSIRMLVMLSNGEQRLITFTLPSQACTIQEILEQVGVPLQPDTPIEVSEANSNGINYMVSVGFLQSTCQSEEQRIDSVDNSCQTATVTEAQSQVTPSLPPPPPPPPPPSQSPAAAAPVREPSPEPMREIEQPKFVDGKMAVCGYCGILSEDFNKCTRCKTKLPDNVKTVASLNSMKKNEETCPSKNQIALHSNGTKEPAITAKRKVTLRTRNENEPVILTLSSDEEEEVPEKATGSINENILQKLGSAITLSPIIKKEPSMSDMQKTVAVTDGEKTKVNCENLKSISLQCRTVRIGSYRTIPKENVLLEYSKMTIKIASADNAKEIVTLTIDRNDIVKVLISFHKQLPVLFYYLRPNMGPVIREMLGMKENDVNYYDPLSDNESHRRITLLPEHITEEAITALQQLYRTAGAVNILDELTVKEANDILIKTCPKELTLANLQPSSGSIFEVKLLLTYPPEGKGRISINTEDYMCLGSDQFLNDVIIDFYLKFLVHNLTPEEQDRIHVFSTFFYKRLTTKPVKASRKIQPTELDPTLTPAEKRHARVKTWTKNIDLFKKDYVIVPINENCHWFLAIICFPGIEGCQTMDGHPIKIEIAPKSKKNTIAKTTIGNVTITAMKKEYPCEDIESDKDEAEGDESELESDDSDETPTVTSHANRPPIKQPCILIFDSLAGTGRSRVVATLRDYLTCEYKMKYAKEKVFNKDVIKGACPKVPQQTNFTDCGLYLLQYVEHFFMEPIKDYYIPINSLKNWFDELTVTRKREDISILIKTLMMEYNKDVGLLPEIMFPTKNGVVVDQFGDDEEMEDEMSENEEFGTPPMGSETEAEASMSTQDEEASNVEGSPMKPSREGVSDKNDMVEQTISNIELLKPDLSELTLSKQQSSRDTLSYLKAKRIIRHKNLDSPNKKMKNSD